MQQFAESQTHDERKGNSEGRVDKAAASRLDYFVQIHAEAQCDDRSLQQKSREISAVGWKRMSNAEAEEYSGGQGDGRRDVAARGDDETGEEKRFDD